jgi:5-methyltetrahydropteroyltriglutamate--homocysteine methyltransferase
MSSNSDSATPRAQTQPPFRADHVGSFLRPKALLEARDRHKAGAIDAQELRAVEDDAIRQIVRFQEDLGLRSITDGEFRRYSFHTDFLVQLGGVVRTGRIAGRTTQVTQGKTELAPPVLQVDAPVRHIKPILRGDFEFVASITRHTPKVTMPSPTMLHFRGGRAGISLDAYPDLEQFYADVAAAYAAELRSLADAGCGYVQLDDTNLAYLCDVQQREAARQRGDDPDELPRRYARLINAAIANKPSNMVIGVHLCRGNFRSSWAAEGGYEPVAEVLFNELNVDCYFLEYDDARSGDFQPLRFVPKNKTVVLGLVTTKLGQLESRDDIKRRIDEAARVMPLEQLCLSPQCGFSSTVQGNDIAVEQQAEKLRLVVDVARDVWGTA